MTGNFATIYVKFKRYGNNGQVFIDFASTLEVGRLNFSLFYLSPPLNFLVSSHHWVVHTWQELISTCCVSCQLVAVISSQ